MAGFDERANRPKPHRALQHEYDDKYSDGLDYSIGAGTLNATPTLNQEQHNPKSSKKLRGKCGLIFKEPLY